MCVFVSFHTKRHQLWARLMDQGHHSHYLRPPKITQVNPNTMKAFIDAQQKHCAARLAPQSGHTYTLEHCQFCGQWTQCNVPVSSCNCCILQPPFPVVCLKSLPASSWHVQNDPVPLKPIDSCLVKNKVEFHLKNSWARLHQRDGLAHEWEVGLLWDWDSSPWMLSCLAQYIPCNNERPDGFIDYC